MGKLHGFSWFQNNWIPYSLALISPANPEAIYYSEKSTEH